MLAVTRSAARLHSRIYQVIRKLPYYYYYYYYPFFSSIIFSTLGKFTVWVFASHTGCHGRRYYVVPLGLEPMTFCVKGRRDNHYSMEPLFFFLFFFLELFWVGLHLFLIREVPIHLFSTDACTCVFPTVIPIWYRCGIIHCLPHSWWRLKYLLTSIAITRSVL